MPYVIAVVAVVALLALTTWRAGRRTAESNDERDRQQHNLEQQAIELEEQAMELELQVQELERANAALIAAESATAIAHREALDAMAERSRQAALFDAALRTVPIAMAIIDKDLRYIRVNAACARMTGIEVEAHPGRLLRDVNPLLAPELEAMMRKVIATGEPCINHRLTRPTPHARGGNLEIVMHITPFRDVDGTILGICSTASDVSDWKALQDQLFQAQKLEAAGMLAAGIAHDFNNLLAIVACYCDLLLLELGADSPHRGEITEILGAATRASALARRMLGMAGSRTIVETPIELRDVLLESRDILSHALRHSVLLEMNCAAETAVICADPTNVEQILLNLVVNAADAMEQGGTIAVNTRQVSLTAETVMRTGPVPAGDYVEVSVRDTGTGMDDATLARIFEPFFTTKPVGKGTGLGLATVLGITRDMKGGVEVESAPWKGTTFRILFPRMVSEEATKPREARKAVAPLPRGDATILVVDDEDALRASLARLLTRQGYRVLEASNGGEALRIIGEEPGIALIVSDLDMPGVGGRELSQRVRSMGRTLPMLFMSGSSGDGDVVSGITGMDPARDRFIAKPFELAQMLTLAREMIPAKVAG